MTQARLSRANLAACQRQVEELQNGLAKLRKENEKKGDRLRTLRETLASRRRSISAAKLQTSPTSAIHSATPSTSSPSSLEAEHLSTYHLPSHERAPGWSRSS
ncbi:hypothetical protein BDZ97DRAFT_1840452 [Flammula alnicola]|nr:hypothetical protein BDZ97DRAFT_1840452 [Flammula alnicola]